MRKELPRLVLLISLFFLPVISLSFLGIDNGHINMGAKVAFMSTVAFFAISLLLFSAYKENKMCINNSPITWVVCASILIVFFSGIVSTVPNISFFGYFYEPGTVLVYVSLFLVFLLTVALSQKTNKFVYVNAIIFSFLLFLCIEVFGLVFIHDSNVFSSTDTLVGSYADTALFASIALILSLTTASFLKNISLRKVVMYYSVSLISGITLFVYGNTFLFLVLAVLFGAVFMFARYNFFLFKMKVMEAEPRYILLSGIMILFGVVHMLGFSPSSSGLMNTPHYMETISIAQDIYQQSATHALFGSGPLTYEYSVGENHKMYGDFFGFVSGSFFERMLIETGLLGIFSWIISGVLILFYGISRLPLISREERPLTLGLLLLLITFFVSFLFYTPGSTLFILFFIMLGLFVALVSTDKDYVIVYLSKTRKIFFMVIVVMFLLFTSAYIYRVYASIHSFLLFNSAKNSITSSNLSDAQKNLERARSISMKDIYYRTYAETVNEIVRDSYRSREKSIDIAKVIQSAADSSERAVSLNPLDVQNWHMLGQTLTLLTQMNPEEDPIPRAEFAYQKALGIREEDPIINLEYAYLLFYFKGDREEARIYAQNAVSLRQNFTEAEALLRDINNSQ